jgi:hypothetical protein
LEIAKDDASTPPHLLLQAPSTAKVRRTMHLQGEIDEAVVGFENEFLPLNPWIFEALPLMS